MYVQTHMLRSVGISYAGQVVEETIGEYQGAQKQ